MRDFKSKDNLIYRELSRAQYDEVKSILENKGIQNLILQKNIVPTWVKEDVSDTEKSYILLLIQEKPRMVSYPFEWSFHMLKDAALLYLTVVKECMKLNLSLNTGRANSVLFLNGKMQFNDVLEITNSSSEDLWPGYREFLETFLFPLLFNSKFGVDFSIWWRGTLRGLSFAEAKKLLKDCDQFNDIVLKLELPKEDDYKSEIIFADRGNAVGLIDELINFTSKIEQKYSQQELHWIDYQKNNDYSDPDVKAKEIFVVNGLKQLGAQCVIDLGANTGHYSKLLQDYVSHVISIDCESACIDALYASLKDSQNTKITPMLCNMLNPSADLGYDLKEYCNFFTRANADFFLALAVMHHITVPTHISLQKFIKSLKNIAPGGVIEWVSPEEEMSKKELTKTKHRNKDYNWDNFISLVNEDFQVIDILNLHSEHRTLCLLGPKK
jgi:hypothetical protein